MYNQIKKIFKPKITENIQQLDDNNYYYFYQDQSCTNIFAIKKDITQSEYSLLKSIFIEKKKYSVNSKEQKIYEYLFENKEFPFNEDQSFIVYYAFESDRTTISELISAMYTNCIFVNYLNYTIVFSKKFDNVKSMFQALTMDIGYEVVVHEGFLLSSKVEGKELLKYLNFYSKNFEKEAYTKFTDVVIKANNNQPEVIQTIKKSIIDKIISQHSLVELINTFFINNLNVSQTSKLLYMHRNSLLNKLEQIEKMTLLNIQNFLDAYVMNILLNIGNKL